MTKHIRVRSARAEATSLLPAGHEARVLEPSPPANQDPEWYADDPTDPSGSEVTVVTPIPGEGVTWAELAAHNPTLRAFASENWLDGSRQLAPLPDGYATTRESMHQLAYFGVAPARHAVSGKLGLRYTKHGFGTPFFGADEQVRIESDLLVRQVAEEADAIRPKTVAEACRFLGIPYREIWFEDFGDPLTPVGPEAPLEINTDAARAIGDWFGFSTLALERLRRTPAAIDVSRVQLWPEHFDPAIEMGSKERGQRASYGGSPGDENHDEPYLYVSAWGEIDRTDSFWNDESFNGASLPYGELLASEDQTERALDFFLEGYRRLGGGN